MSPALLPSPAALLATARSIAAVQSAEGVVPWEVGGQVDVWDHVECLMAMDVMGLHAEASAGYEWLRRTQRPDGSWAARYSAKGSVVDPTGESNHAAYVAVGVLQHWLSAGSLLPWMWPMVHRALGFVVGLANPDGTIGWARSLSGSADPTALLTGCSSIHHALRCGVLLASGLGHFAVATEWSSVADRLQNALCAAETGLFADRSRFSMDWYYPVLGGALLGASALERLSAGVSRFEEAGWGIRCVADQPWVTGAETCELALAYAVLGESGRASELVMSMQHLRHEDGSYWTGVVLTDGVRWPVERSTWTGGAVILASNALAGGGIFRPWELESELAS